MPKPNGVHALVRRTHEERILVALREHGSLSRAQLADVVGLSRTTVSEITGTLVSRGAVVVQDTDAAGRTGSGRPAERLALDPASGQYLGVDFGLKRVNVVVVDASHEVIAQGTAPYAEAIGWAERADRAFELIDGLSARTGVHLGAVQAVGIGVPGWGYRTFTEEFGDAFAERFGARTAVDNNGRLAGLAEALHSRSGGIGDLVYLRIADGVGGGLVVDGRLLHGSAGFAGALGHVTVDPGGAMCRCGKRGCVETVASVPAIVEHCRENGLVVGTLDELADAITHDHPVADAAIRRAGQAVGRSLASVAMVLNPGEIVVGGEIAQLAPALLEEVATVVTQELSWRHSDLPVLRRSELDDYAGALGAVATVIRESPLLAPSPREDVPSAASGSRRTAS